MTAWEAGHEPDPARPTGELLVDLVEELRRLGRAEVQLALIETRRKAKSMGIAAMAAGTAGALGLVGLGVFAACAVFALAIVLPGWLAALLVGVGVFLMAGMALLVARFAARRAGPITPRWTMESVRADVDTIRKGARP